MTVKRTALFNAHKKLGARFVDFGGWEMPIQYTSIIEEHRAVRSAAGIFDISHMGEVTVAGPAAAAFLNHVLTNDIGKLDIGRGQYTLMCNESGGTIDDLYAYHIGPELYLLIVNASRIQADVSWLKRQAAQFPDSARVDVGNTSENYAAVAIQGPRVKDFIDLCIAESSDNGRFARVTELKKNDIAAFPLDGTNLFVSRTGYTGEDGFEIVGLADAIALVWEKTLAAGRAFGVKPAGLGARDTLRTEACYPLYGHELDEKTTPIEAGVGFFVALDKGEFIGRSILAGQKASGLQKKCVAFKMAGKSAPPRPHYPIWSAGDNAARIGEVTSGTLSPSLGIGIGLGYVPPELAGKGTPIEIEIRGKRAPAMVAAKPIYKKG